MNELIKISQATIADERVQTVDARELHFFIESKQQFSNWITNRIRQYGFMEDIDFTSLNKNIKAETTYINTKEYTLTLNMAYQLSMVERNEKGRMAREYFIDCERRLRQGMPGTGMAERIRKLKELAEIATAAGKTAKVACTGRAERCEMVNDIILAETGRDLRAEFPGIVPSAAQPSGHFAIWAAERIELDRAFCESTVEVYDDYRQWAYESGHHAIGRNHFYQEVQRRLPVAKKQQGITRRMSFVGLRLAPEKPVKEKLQNKS